jgi:ABC-2 type transport system permease protein
MRVLRVLLRKEYLQIFRDKLLLRQMILMPFIQLIVLSSAATFEVKTARIYLVDRDQSAPIDSERRAGSRLSTARAR